MKPRPKKEKMRLKRERKLVKWHTPHIKEPVVNLVEKTRIYPIPEILDDGRGWRIRHDKDRIGIDYTEKVIFVPLDDEPVSHCLKLQQIARIKWDDRNIELDNNLLSKAVEDHRLSYLLTEADINIQPGFFNEQSVKLLEGIDGEVGGLAMMLMSDYTENAPKEGFVFENRTEKLVGLFVEVRKRVRENPSKANVVNIVAWLRQYIKDVEQPKWMKSFGGKYIKGIPLKGPGQASDMTLDEYYELAWDECEEDMKLQEIPSDVRAELPTSMPEPLARSMEVYKKQYNKEVGFVPWGDPHIEEPPRSLAATGKFVKKWKATDEGVFPRYPHRYAVDQRVFARRIKMPGGTVIIDSSGSMGLTPEAIRLMVEHAPGCVVANYSGTSKRGVIRILAKNGKRVQDNLCAPPCGGGNIVDYHGLRWAYKLSHPRIWISDLGVTGVNDQPAPGNLAMCAAVVRKGRFFHGHNVNEAIEIFRRLGRFYRKYSSQK